MNIVFHDNIENKINFLDRKILLLMLDGHSQLNIAATLKYSDRHIREHIIRLKNNFNAKNVYQLIYMVSSGNLNAA